MPYITACADYSALTGLGFTVVGLLIGSLTAHYLTKDRDAATRKFNLLREADVRRRSFRKFVRLCRYRLERIEDEDSEAVWKCYTELAPEIMSEAALVQGDFTNISEVARLVCVAGEWKHEEANARAEAKGCSLREVLRDSIKAIDDATHG